MKSINSTIIYKAAAAVVILLLAVSMLFACTRQEAPKEEEPKEEPKVEYTANSPLGIAESYIGKNVQDLILEVGTLKGDPVIEPSNDGGGYEGTYEFDGFTVKTYAKAEDAEAVVTEVIPDEDSQVYKDSIKDSDDAGGDK